MTGAGIFVTMATVSTLMVVTFRITRRLPGGSGFSIVRHRVLGLRLEVDIQLSQSCAERRVVRLARRIRDGRGRCGMGRGPCARDRVGGSGRGRRRASVRASKPRPKITRSG